MPIMLLVSFIFAPTNPDENWELQLEVGVNGKYELWGDANFPKYLQRRLCDRFKLDLKDINLDPDDPDLILRDGIKFVVFEGFIVHHYRELPEVVEDEARFYTGQRDKPMS